LSSKINGVNGVRINIEDIGSGTPIVFIHGWPVNHNTFEYQFTELPKHGYRCIGIDLRGFGESDKPWDGYNYDTMADDVKAVLDTLNLQNAIKGSQLVQIEKAGHGFYYEERERVNSQLVKFSG
jgi:pimeloyl-ACP methyl ester carboxylesterase